MLEFRFNGLKPVANVFICLVLFFYLLRAKALHTAASTKQTQHVIHFDFAQYKRFAHLCRVTDIFPKGWRCQTPCGVLADIA